MNVLRRFELADDDNLPRQVKMIRITHPDPTNTLASFRFLKTQFYLLIDNSADDDVHYIVDQIKNFQPNLSGELIKNPGGSNEQYALPYKGKTCYLYESVTQKRRLDIELAEKYPEKSRSTWQKYIKTGYITVNGKLITVPKYEISDSDVISVSLPEPNNINDIEIPILYLDDNVIVINKPCGILTHSKGAVCEELTVADFFRKYSNYNLNTNRPGIVHRLDRDTSGVMIGARNSETALMLQKQFSNRKTKKVYYAVIGGVPKLTKANIDVPIGRNPSRPSTFRPDVNGKSAQTTYEALAFSNGRTLVKLQPLTGRTHQLRVHMQYINTPIIGDKIYGKSGERLFLHAYSLEITIPGSKRLEFIAPLPDDMLIQFSGVKI